MDTEAMKYAARPTRALRGKKRKVAAIEAGAQLARWEPGLKTVVSHDTEEAVICGLYPVGGLRTLLSAATDRVSSPSPPSMNRASSWQLKRGGAK